MKYWGDQLDILYSVLVDLYTYISNEVLISVYTDFLFSNPVELVPEHYGLSAGSQELLDTTGIYYGASGNSQMTVAQLIESLEKDYCDTIAAEYQYLQVHWFY